MATAEAEIISRSNTHRYSVEEYYKMTELGFFDGEHVELIEGEVLNMSAMGRPHVWSVKRTAELLETLFEPGWFVQTQAPLRFGERSEPEPDVAVVKGRMEDYPTEHPTTADLIVEVSDKTLYYDRKQKASLYAKAGIADYWVLNLKKNQLEIFRRPIPDPDAFYGFTYSEMRIVIEGELASPLVKPEAAIAVTEMLPPSNYR
jgi:Uma2 family endonuclease